MGIWNEAIHGSDLKNRNWWSNGRPSESACSFDSQTQEGWGVGVGHPEIIEIFFPSKRPLNH